MKTSPAAKAGREAKWRTTFIVCKKHPLRRCLRGGYRNRGERLCASCKDRQSNGIKVRKKRLEDKNRFNKNPRNFVYRTILGMEPNGRISIRNS